MKRKIAYLFPGQGAQYVGMGYDWYQNFIEAKQVFDQADQELGYPLSQIIFEGPFEELTKTKNSQLAIFVTCTAMLSVLQAKGFPFLPEVCAGLSLGEYTALYAAGWISWKDALFLIQKRAEFMNQACEENPGAMAAVLGLSDEVIQQVISPLKGVWIANLNAPGQIVISGKEEVVQQASDLLKQAKARRVLPLPVQGAFHSPLMESAQKQLSPYIDQMTFKKGSIPVVMNVNAKKAQQVEQLPPLLKEQVTHSVRWYPSILEMVEEGVDTFIEIGCGKTLTVLNQRICPGKMHKSIEKVQDWQEKEGFCLC